MKITWPAAARANCYASSQMGFRARCEGRDFLMPHVYPLNVTALAVRIGETIETIANDSINAPDACGFQDVDELFGNIF